MEGFRKEIKNGEGASGGRGGGGGLEGLALASQLCRY